jgi:CRISPR-associated endonuclease Cas1
MHPQSTVRAPSRATSPSVAPIIPKDGIVTLDGYGIRVAVERGHLAIGDGICDERRAGLLHRATCKLRRLAVIGHTGTISLEALRWLADAGASLTVIDKDGAVILAHGPRGRDDGRLRRAQAVAPYTGANIPIIRLLLSRKLAGQVENLERFARDALAIHAILSYAASLDESDTLVGLRALEANAANAYWEALADVPITFGKRDRVPDHWRTFGSRASAITGNPRKATNPINAMLNYVYAILEAEASITLQAVGLDPALGVLHADMPNRDSLACDVMEAVRPQVDAFILDLLAGRTFSADAFCETREGVCRVLPPLTHTLAQTGPVWAKSLAPIIEDIAQAFMDSALPAFGAMGIAPRGASRRAAAPNPEALPTILTQRKRSTGRDRHRRQPVRGTPEPTALFPGTCRSCGLPLPEQGRLYCEGCRPERQAEVLARWSEHGPKALAGTNHGGVSGERRGRTNATHQQAIRAWERQHGTDHDPRVFTERILPSLRGVPLSRLVAATGLSLRYCSLVRRGEHTPHPMHWDAFVQAGSIHR